MGVMDEMALLVHEVHLVEMEGMGWLDHRVSGESLARIWGYLGHKENKVSQAHKVPLG